MIRPWDGPTCTASPDSRREPLHGTTTKWPLPYPEPTDPVAAGAAAIKALAEAVDTSVTRLSNQNWQPFDHSIGPVTSYGTYDLGTTSVGPLGYTTQTTVVVTGRAGFASFDIDTSFDVLRLADGGAVNRSATQQTHSPRYAVTPSSRPGRLPAPRTPGLRHVCISKGRRRRRSVSIPARPGLYLITRLD